MLIKLHRLDGTPVLVETSSIQTVDPNGASCAKITHLNQSVTAVQEGVEVIHQIVRGKVEN